MCSSNPFFQFLAVNFTVSHFDAYVKTSKNQDNSTWRVSIRLQASILLNWLKAQMFQNLSSNHLLWHYFFTVVDHKMLQTMKNHNHLHCDANVCQFGSASNFNGSYNKEMMKDQVTNPLQFNNTINYSITWIPDNDVLQWKIDCFDWS